MTDAVLKINESTLALLKMIDTNHEKLLSIDYVSGCGCVEAETGDVIEITYNESKNVWEYNK